MSNINIETKNGVVIAKELMITDYNDREIGATGFEKKIAFEDAVSWC